MTDPAESDDGAERQPSARETDQRTGRAAAAARIAQQQTWVDQQIRIAMERGDFDNLPGAGKPLPDLGGQHDPDWWLKKLVEREQITVLPESVELRKVDAELDGVLDALFDEADVRERVEEFNARVLRARYSLSPGPPLVTMPRDVKETLGAWRERREARRAERATAVQASPPGRRRWWRRSRK